MSRVVALTGATGFVGRAVLARALAQKIPIRALTRKPQAAVPGLEWVSGSLEDAEALETLCEGAHSVLHIAGVVNAPDRAGFINGNITGTLRLLDAAQQADCNHFVHVSSLAARSPDLSVYGWSKAQAEKAVLQAPLQSYIVRPPAIYGPHDRDMFELFKMARRGMVMLPPKGRLSLIHVDDLARLLLLLADVLAEAKEQLPSDCPQLMEVDDGAGNGYSHAEMADMLGHALGRDKTRHIHAPAAVLKLAALADRAIRRDQAKLTPDRARYMVHRDWVIDPAKRPPEHFWQPEIDAIQGLTRTATWYAQQGWLSV